MSLRVATSSAHSSLPMLDCTRSPSPSPSTSDNLPPVTPLYPSPTASDFGDAQALPSPAEPTGFLQAPSLLPAFDYRFPVSETIEIPEPSQGSQGGRSRLAIAHPYARLFSKKDGAKRRKIWNHALEKSVFTPQEMYVKCEGFLN